MCFFTKGKSKQETTHKQNKNKTKSIFLDFLGLRNVWNSMEIALNSNAYGKSPFFALSLSLLLLLGLRPFWFIYIACAVIILQGIFLYPKFNDGCDRHVPFFFFYLSHTSINNSHRLTLWKSHHTTWSKWIFQIFYPFNSGDWMGEIVWISF